LCWQAGCGGEDESVNESDDFERIHG
jgi:hypothetical protein